MPPTSMARLHLVSTSSASSASLYIRRQAPQDQAATVGVGGNDTYGIAGIPSTVGGRGVVRREGLGASTQIVYPGSGHEDA